MALGILLNNFHQAILDKNTGNIIPAIKPNPRISPEEQLSIYIDGYSIRLSEAIKSDYPAFLQLIGIIEFEILARKFIKKNPPASYNLDRYPHNFAEFLTSSIEDIFALDLANLEAAIARVFMMEESQPLEIEQLANLPPEEFANIILRPRKASLMLNFQYNVNDWLTMQREGKDPGIAKTGEFFIYIYRHNNNVQRKVLDASAYLLLSNLFKNLTLEEALTEAVNEHPEYEETIAGNLQNWFQEWTLAGFFQQQS